MATYSNIYIDQGSTYTSVIPVKDSNGLPLNLSDYSSRGQIRKSYSSNVKVSFTTSITSPLEGKVLLSLTALQTRAMKAGRYVYDVEIYNGSDTVIRIAEGQVEINPGISNSDIDIELPPVQTLSEIIDDRIDVKTVVVDKLLPLSAEEEARFYSNTNLTTRLQEKASTVSPSFTGNVTFGTGATITLPNNSITGAMIVNGTIVNADISTAAAIAGSKITPAFADGDISTTTGSLTIGNTTQFESRIGTKEVTPQVQIIALGNDDAGALFGRFSADAAASRHSFIKSRATTKGGHAIVHTGDDLGMIVFGGSDGIKIVEAARIHAEVDGAPNVNNVPGRLLFSTTSPGAATPTERMRVDSSGISTLNNLKVGYSKTGAGISQIEIYSSAGASSAANSLLQRGSGDNGNFTLSDSGAGDVVISKNNNTGSIIFKTSTVESARLTISNAGTVSLGTTPTFSSSGNTTVATTNYVAQAIGAPVVSYGNQTSNIRDIASTDVAKYIRYIGTNAVTFNILSTLTGTVTGSYITFRRATEAGAITLSAGEGVTINENLSASMPIGKTFSIKLVDSANKIWDFID